MDANDLKRERAFVGVFLSLVCLVLARFVHDGWVRYLSEPAPCPPAASAPTKVVLTWLPATLPAPQVYRIAIPALGRMVIRLFHLHNPTYVAAGFDFVFSFLALNIFYRLTTEKTGIEEVPGNRALVVVLFLAFIQFPLMWVVPWQRPETLPSALFLAVALFSLVRSRESAKWSVLLLLAAVFQAFVRSDVALVFGIALTAVSLAGHKSNSFGSRRSNLINGLLVIFVAGGTQAYLQFVRFPHRHYPPGTDVIQFRNNLHFHNLSSASLAVAPFLLLGAIVAVRRISLDALEILIVVSSVLYFGLWFTVGLAQEVRIFVPFLLALCVVAARKSALLIRESARSEPAQARSTR